MKNEALVGKKNETFEATDELGRVLRVRKPGMLAQYRHVAMLGKSADSETYMNMTMPLTFLYAIDEDDTIGFSTIREMEGLIARLGDEGVSCLMKLMEMHFSSEKSSDAGKAALKK